MVRQHDAQVVQADGLLSEDVLDEPAEWSLIKPAARVLLFDDQAACVGGAGTGKGIRHASRPQPRSLKIDSVIDSATLLMMSSGGSCVKSVESRRSSTLA